MDDSTCKLPSGGEYYRPFGWSPTTITFVVAPLIGLLPLFVLFGIPALWRSLGSLLGAYLRRKTDGRRIKILEVMDEDERKFAEKQEKKSLDSDASKGEEDGGWEKVQPYSAASTPDGNKLAEDWSGIVGFFHPFWYVLCHIETRELAD